VVENEAHNDNVILNHDDDPHPTDYYMNQDAAVPPHEGYAHRAIAKRLYKCTECSEAFLTKDSLKYHTHEAHYDYFASTYHIAIALIGYATVKANLGTLNSDLKLICLDSEASHTLVD